MVGQLWFARSGNCEKPAGIARPKAKKEQRRVLVGNWRGKLQTTGSGKEKRIKIRPHKEEQIQELKGLEIPTDSGTLSVGKLPVLTGKKRKKSGRLRKCLRLHHL